MATPRHLLVDPEYAFTVLSNHFHLVLRHDPLIHRDWSDEEVAWRWFEAFPPTEHGAVVEELKPERRELLLDDPKRVARARRTLGSMSDFMKHLKQPIARRANLEDDCTGHFFEQRFYSGALLTEEVLIAAMACAWPCRRWRWRRRGWRGRRMRVEEELVTVRIVAIKVSALVVRPRLAGSVEREGLLIRMFVVAGDAYT